MRQARLAAGLTLAELSKRMSSAGQEITKAGLSKYENEGSTPDAGFLLTLADILGLRSSFFISEPAFNIEWKRFRKKVALGTRKQERIKSRAELIIEGRLWLEDLLHPNDERHFPKAVPVGSFEDVEKAANDIRRFWNLGDASILSLTNALEDRGCIVVGINSDLDGFDGLSGWINGTIPAIVSNQEMPSDRFRYNLAHELGHLLISFNGESDKLHEEYAHRFAAAFLVPMQVAYNELGHKRRSISFQELVLLKREYGLSMQAWIRRALDLGIISDSVYNRMFRVFSTRGWRKREPAEFHGDEKPVRYRQMLYRALEEGIITIETAKRIALSEDIDEMYFLDEEAREHPTARELLQMPKAERLRYLALAAEKAKKEYREDSELSGFDAYGDGDFDD